jgi:hypothetical protein
LIVAFHDGESACKPFSRAYRWRRKKMPLSAFERHSGWF